jgi:hypothetical protein
MTSSAIEDRLPYSIDRRTPAESAEVLTSQRGAPSNIREAELQRPRSSNGGAAMGRTERTGSKLDRGRVKTTKAIQASHTSQLRLEKRHLAVMTLRTIRFPDGRQVTQLIPYRGGARTLAFGSDD